MSERATMRLSCPTCRQPLSAELICPAGHRFHEANGILVLLDETFAGILAEHGATLLRYRSDTGRRLLDPAVYEGLPHSLARQHFEWRMRCHDLTVVTRRVGRRPQHILDVGAWNGWLSQRLTKLGHRVTAADYFTDEYDGLGARRHYQSPTWRPVQLDLADLSVLGGSFDVVILNRCLAFFSDPIAYVEQIQGLLAPGALLLLTGLAFFRDPRVKTQQVAELRREYRQRYGGEVFLRPTKGHLDWNDRRELKRRGIELHTEWRLPRAQLEAMVRRSRPFYCWGSWRRPT